MSEPGVRFGVLGPLVARNGNGPLALPGPRHRAVLARLLIARGRVVPVRWIVDDLWDDPPEGALGAVQTFVGALRRALEPDRAPRAPSRLLVTEAPGYALRAGAGEVDAWRFEAAVGESADLLATGRAQEALDRLDEVLALWRGPAYAEVAELDWARGEVARLDGMRLLAVGRRAEAALALGRAAEAVPDLEARVAARPLHEDGWRQLALALYRTGRQGDALAALREARHGLRNELGVDPGPALRRLETDILEQAPHLLVPGPVTVLSRKSLSGGPFVGRAEELAQLRAAAEVAAGGRPRLALVSGAAGAGKTALARALTARLAAEGWTTAWGSSPELPGAPAAWPWSRIGHDLGGATPPETGEDPAAARFGRLWAITGRLAEIGRRTPVLVVLDDLHWADEETLALLTGVVTDPGAGPVLVVATYRSTEIPAGLADALGRAARAEPARIYLGGLSEPQVHDLVRAVTDRPLSAADLRAVHRRSGGNPFYVGELTRLWQTEGAAAWTGVPAGVRDVIRRRLTRLDETTRTHLRQAAVIGPDVDLDVLGPLGGGEDDVLNSVETALEAGFLVETTPGRVSFTHALVQETLYVDISRARRARWHAAVAGLVEATRPDDAETIAHHLVRAGDRVDAARTARHLRTAAERAEQRSAPHEAARLWRETLTALDRSGDERPGDDRVRLEADMGLVRALAVSGDLEQARRRRGAAVTAAEALGDPELTAAVIGAFAVPAIWTANDDEDLSARLVEAAERTLLALPAARAAERARLLAAIAMERRADTGPRGLAAAREAEAIARERNDPALLALALNGRFLQSFDRAGLAPQRARIGAELLGVSAGRPSLVTFDVLGHLIRMQAAAAQADLPAADRHASAADLLAERHDLPLVGVFTAWYAAVRLTVTGRTAAAGTAYRQAAARLTGTGMTGLADGLLPFARLGLAASATTGADPEQDLVVPDDLLTADWGRYEPWARPLILFAQGRSGAAGSAARAVPESPRDLFFEAHTALHALIAIRTGDQPRMRHLYEQLLPAAAELAGAGSGLVSLGPAAVYLGRLSRALGRPDEAEGHFRTAVAVLKKIRQTGARAVDHEEDRTDPPIGT